MVDKETPMNGWHHTIALSLLALLAAVAPLGPVPAQADASLSDGDLLQARGDDKVHLVRGGRRHWVADTASLHRLDPDLARLRRVPFEEVDRLPAGKPYRQLP